jgi:hypothetical protein
MPVLGSVGHDEYAGFSKSVAHGDRPRRPIPITS